VKNRGQEFEKRLQKVHDFYAMNRLAKIEKVAPPVLVIRGKQIMMRNPFLDFTGVWTERDGRALVIEAKFTADEERMGICGSGGVSENQYSNLWAWRDAGAVCAVLWFNAKHDTIRMATVPMLAQCVQAGRKSIRWDEMLEVPRSDRGHWDYLALLEQAMPPKK
jgi:penicillin-binding protein-related factor A (putative recombinase)